METMTIQPTRYATKELRIGDGVRVFDAGGQHQFGTVEAFESDEGALVRFLDGSHAWLHETDFHFNILSAIKVSG